MKIAILTRTGFHHASFINRMLEEFEIACVVRESYPEKKKENPIKSFMKQHGLGLTKDEIFLNRFHESWSAGFRNHPGLKEYLKAPFDVVIEKKTAKYLSIRCGEINSLDLEVFLKDIGPDIIAVLGSSIIKPNIITIPKIAMINIHTGLSPYYRGTWSYGWPIVNKEPEYIGVTLHHINSGIDSGDIIYQTRPMLDIHDDLNTIFLKVVSEGIELAVMAVKEIQKNRRIKSYKQPVNAGRLYLAKDFNAETARTCLSNLEEGIIGKYIRKKKEADSGVKLYGFVPPQISK
jgi:folate-dependent phosphoribosylglycinamide formyltransferase PurN